MAISDTNWYVLTSCCDELDVINLSYDNTAEPLANGVYTYTGTTNEDLINGQCYEIAFVSGTPPFPLDPLAPIDFNAVGANNCGEISPEDDCNCPVAYSIRNCYDETLIFTTQLENQNPLNINDVFSLNIEGDLIVEVKENLCHEAIAIEHPDINNGEVDFYDITSFVQDGLYNGQPYYKFDFDETVHGNSNVSLTFYTIYNSTSDRWEIWDTFDLVNGPSNTSCNIQDPYIYLGPTVNNTGLDCSLSPIPTLNECSYFTINNECDIKILGNRNVAYCLQNIIVENFVNCWKIIEEVSQSSNDVSYEIDSEYEDCNTCINTNNYPPCIKLTNCNTNEISYYSFIPNSGAYLDKVIKVLFQGVEYCYKVELSDTCPEVTTILQGEILDCYTTCKKCLPEPVKINTPTYRKVTPNYVTGLCDPEIVEKAFCDYAKYLHEEVIAKRFFIKNCCPKDGFKLRLSFEKIKNLLMRSKKPVPDSCNPICYSYRATVIAGYKGITTYTDCNNEEQTIITEISNNNEVVDFCALDTSNPTLEIYNELDELEGSYAIPTYEECN